FFWYVLRLLPCSPLFAYTTLFRSASRLDGEPVDPCFAIHHLYGRRPGEFHGNAARLRLEGLEGDCKSLRPLLHPPAGRQGRPIEISGKFEAGICTFTRELESQRLQAGFA